jgi:hypothetical protein
MAGRYHEPARTAVVVLCEVEHRAQGEPYIDHIASGREQPRDRGVLEIQGGLSVVIADHHLADLTFLEKDAESAGDALRGFHVQLLFVHSPAQVILPEHAAKCCGRGIDHGPAPPATILPPCIWMIKQRRCDIVVVPPAKYAVRRSKKKWKKRR